MISISFYQKNINPEVVAGQKAVFEKLGIEHKQILTTKSHSDAIDFFLKKYDWETLFLWDIDCIPLRKEIIDIGLGQVKDKRTLFGAAQKANHIIGSEIYVSPAFMVLTKSLWKKLGKPSFMETNRGDVGSELSYKSDEKNLQVRLLYPSSVEEPVWDLKEGIKFGFGTTYQDSVYHAFQSRLNHQSTINFISKCNEVLR